MSLWPRMFLPAIACGSFTPLTRPRIVTCPLSSLPCHVPVPRTTLLPEFQGSGVCASHGDVCVISDCTDIRGASVLGCAPAHRMSELVPGFLGLRGRKET